MWAALGWFALGVVFTVAVLLILALVSDHLHGRRASNTVEDIDSEASLQRERDLHYQRRRISRMIDQSHWDLNFVIEDTAPEEEKKALVSAIIRNIDHHKQIRQSLG